MWWAEEHNETPSLINVHLKECDISDTSTKKIIRETDLENLRLPEVGRKMRRDVVSKE